ncbi:hypothetical protein [Methanocella sp. MCL-LM]|uniref:hypothetical protein n=1 Tax=Methanocella sp. MCL-LM TaxID=3412035 RepID=UPI003C721E20
MEWLSTGQLNNHKPNKHRDTGNLYFWYSSAFIYESHSRTLSTAGVQMANDPEQELSKMLYEILYFV